MEKKLVKDIDLNELFLNIDKIKIDLKSKMFEIVDQVPSLNLNQDQKFTELLAKDKFWEIANLLGGYMNKTDDNHKKTYYKGLITDIREAMGNVARISVKAQTIVFGTSGWRDPIGEEFSIYNVHKVVRAIIEMMKSDEFLKENGYSSFDEVKENGIVVFRDNRFMGDEFIAAAIAELTAQGIKVHLAGECPTGVGSALVTELGAAGSINFTPSHNPMEYAGLKFNPADGGPADKNLTSIIEDIANGYMKDTDFVPAKKSADGSKLVSKVNASKIFRSYYDKKAPGEIEALKDYLRSIKDDLCLVIDNMHGSSRGYIEAILGDDFIAEMGDAITFLNTDDDYSFHGIKPEPSAKNQAPIIKMLKASGKKYTLGMALDPDADRIRFATANMDIDMNHFAPMSYAAMLESGMTGGVAYSVATTAWAGAIAAAHNQKVYETAVGFKNFREALSKGNALIAFEESDGYTRFTLEKCAIQGLLAAIDIMMKTNKNLDEYYAACQKKYGCFYPDKDGMELENPEFKNVDIWQAYKKKVSGILDNGLAKIDEEIVIGGEKKKVVDVITVDGLKLVFEDRSWVLVRPSGTEPKFRFYYESVGKGADRYSLAYKDGSAAVLNKALAIADGK